MLRSKHVVLIAIAAILGVIVGYVFMSGQIRSNNDETRPAAGTDSASPTILPANASGAARPNGAKGTVPDVRGQRLPDALAKLEAAGYRKVETKDASPQNRLVIEKDNWVVEAQEPPAGLAAPADTPIILRVKKNTDDSTPAPADLGTVPNVVCAELQDAQEALRRSGFLLITSTDGSGQGRIAAIDRNWVVIGQSASAGTRANLTTHIVLTIVKHGEPTGSSGCKS